MRLNRLQGVVLAVMLLMVGSFVVSNLSPIAKAQTNISGDIAGTVTDPAGAVVQNATVTITNPSTGITKVDHTNNVGSFRISLLPSGLYTVTVTASGFKTAEQKVNVATAGIVSADFKMTLGSGSVTVEVTDQAPLLQTENSDLATTFNIEQIQAIPNPGNDITYYAQTSPGVIMNTGGGYGNFSVFGLPGTSNNFTVNGAQLNDPFLNLNNSGPSNLLLGQNDVSEVNVIANAYGTEFGSFGGVQLNEISRSGNNKFHGNAVYYYNGAVLNANNWFVKQSGASRPGSVNNQWAGAIGGPIIKDKTFFFADFEAIRFVTTTPTRVAVPNANYQATTLAWMEEGGTFGDPGTAAQVPYMENTIFALYNNAAAGHNAQPDPSNPDADYWIGTPKSSLREGLIAGRIDHNLSNKDHLFLHVLYDNGRQPTYVDPLYNDWSMTSPQPEWEGQMAWTRSFSPNVTNQFLLTGAHYSAVFQSVNYTGANALLPYAMIWEDESFYSLNADGYVFPQGRNATQYSFSDDLSWTKGNHTFKFGVLYKRDDISNFDTGIYNTPLVTGFGSAGYCFGAGYDPYCYTNGYNYFNRQIFPGGKNNSGSELGGVGNGSAPDVPIAFYNLGVYAEDVWKATPKLTVTLGMRFERNENPVCQNGCFSRLNNDFFSVAGIDTKDTAYNSILSTGYHNAFPKYWSVLPEPRLGVNYQLGEKTVIRAGVGWFSDVFPAQVTDYLARNAPKNTRYQNLANYLEYGTEVDTPLGNYYDGFTINQASNTVFQGPTGYYHGGSYNSLQTDTGGYFTRPNIYTTNTQIQYPTYEEWSLQVQRDLGHGNEIQVAYVGNHGYHEPVVNNSINSYVTVPGTGFDLPSSRPAVSFGEVVNLQSNASSNYNGLVASFQHRGKSLTFQVNYAWSHALDEVSNGGFLAFTASGIASQIDPYNLRNSYGNADYDVRQNITANYVYTLPYWKGPKVLVADWQFAGTVFYRTGFPFTVTDGATPASGEIGLYYSAIPAAFTGNSVNHKCSRSAGTSPTGCFNDSSSYASPYFTYANSFHDQQRNDFSGPGFFQTDLSVLKGFNIPHVEGAKLQVGAQMYNILNHPNFANPNSDIVNNGGYGFGQIFGTVGAPTGLYGSGLGGDTSIRTIQLKGAIRF